MENKENKSLEAKELLTGDLDKVSGGGIVELEYSYHDYGLRNKEEIKTSTGYYVPKNGKYYKSFEIASETDKALGGDGTIAKKTKYSDCTPVDYEDAWEG